MEPYGLDAITAFDRLAYLKTDTVAGGQSSYDRSGGNADFILEPRYPNFLDLANKTEELLLNLEGPGVIYRIWCTGFNWDTATMNFYIDDAPVQTCPLSLLFGRSTLFPAPLGGSCPHLTAAAGDDGGYYCYVPIPFQRSIRITATATAMPPPPNKQPLGFYYNIGYHRYPSQAQIQSWTGQEDSAAAVLMWNKVGEDPKALHLPGLPSGFLTISNTITSLASGQSASLLDLQGPGSIASIRIRLPLSDQLFGIWLRISWDNDPYPSVNAPLSMFFALGRFAPMQASRSLAVGFDGQWLYAYFPMPFQQHAKIEISNESPFELRDVSYEIQYQGFDDDFSRVGYFKTAFAEQILGAGAGSISFIDVDGAGHLVGVVESIEGPPNVDNKFWFLEGDERVYVDDCRTPIIQGTGTEDFFNSGWYFDQTPFAREMHGCTFISPGGDGWGRVSAHRLFLQDAIPFRKNIRATIEHGGSNDIAVVAWTLAYYYHQPRIRAIQWDTLDVGDPVSEAAHGYSSTAGEIITRSASFEGDQDDVIITESGRQHQGESQFIMSVPSDNQGVILRRMFDQSIADQKAQVLVDGEPIGFWFTAGENPHHPWREDDFLIPSSITSGKTQIAITIQVPPGSNNWTELKYWVYSRQETGNTLPTILSPRVLPSSFIGAASRSTDKLDIVVADQSGYAVTDAWEPSHGAPWYNFGAISSYPVVAGTPVSVASRSLDHLDVFFTNNVDEVCTAAWEPALGWRSWRLQDRGTSPLAVPTDACVTAVCRSIDHLDIFVAASDGIVYTAAWEPDFSTWHGWTPLFSDVQTKAGALVQAVSRSADHLDIFLTDNAGHIFTMAWDPVLGWQHWPLQSRLAPGAFVPEVPPGAPVTAVSRSTDHLDIFVIGTDKVVYTAAWEPDFSTWNGWRPVLGINASPGATVGAVSRSADILDIFTTDAGGQVFTASWSSKLDWQSARLNDRLAPESLVPLLQPGAPVTAVSRSTDHLDILVAATDQRIWTAAWEPSSGASWRIWRPVGY